MGASHFTGPLISGPILNTSGTTLGQDVADWGVVVAGQSEAITQAGTTTALATSIVIPAYSVITSISVIVSTIWASSATLSVGTSATATELVPATALGTVGIVNLTPSTAGGAPALLWANTGSSDIRIYVNSSASTGGVGTIIVQYLQAENVTT